MTTLTAEHRPATKRRMFRHDDPTALDMFSGYFRMMFPHEIGRGCGFDPDFRDYKGTFKVWGKDRDQVDGYGNAVSPAVGLWIGKRLRVALHGSERAA